MLIETFEAGPAATNGYLVCDRRGGTAAVIDAPQGVAAAMVEQALDWQATIRLLLITHAHWDHILDNDELLRLTGARFGIHRESARLLTIPQTKLFGLEIEMPQAAPEFFLEEGEPVAVGDLNFDVLHCPGHCPGSVVLYERRERVVFVGDVLFAGSIGRTDLPGGDHEQLLRSIRQKLLPLGDEVRVLAGHGPPTTIGVERRENPFLA